MQLGGAPKCLKCNKEAYFSEQVHAPGGIYHKLCLKCAACSKRLETSTLNENSGNLYCKTCYQKAFGPVGFGNGVFQTQNTMSPVETSAPAASSTVSSVTTSRESLTKSPMVSQGSAKKFSIPSGNTCPSCSKTVYFAEQVRGPGGVLFHKICFKCSECSKTMSPGTETDKESKLYCKGCYGKMFGPKGVGFGSTLHTEGASSA